MKLMAIVIILLIANVRNAVPKAELNIKLVNGLNI
jgi:hypothetical protein